MKTPRVFALPSKRDSWSELINQFGICPSFGFSGEEPNTEIHVGEAYPLGPTLEEGKEAALGDGEVTWIVVQSQRTLQTTPQGAPRPRRPCRVVLG